MGRNTSEAQEVNTEKGYHLLRRANAIARRALSFRFFRIHCRRSIFQASLDLYDRNWHFVLQYPWCLNRANNHLLQSRHCRMRSKQPSSPSLKRLSTASPSFTDLASLLRNDDTYFASLV